MGYQISYSEMKVKGLTLLIFGEIL